MTEIRDVGPWPPLRYADWKETCAALHLMAQVVGKVRLVQAPWRNHSWHATLYPTARGLTTSPIPHGRRSFAIDFDFFDEVVRIATGEGVVRRIPLGPGSIADFAQAVLGALTDLGLPVRIRELPSEIPGAVPFSADRVRRPWDAGAVRRFHRALLDVERVFQRFVTGFVGKASPVHLFWGALDLAVTRFSGRRAPLHPGGIPGLPDAVVREAYSHEETSAGFWPGGSGADDAAFYCYVWPEPPGFPEAPVLPPAARYDPALREFLLPYEAVRAAPDPEATLLAFLESTYEAAAELGGWDRAALECPPGRPGVPRPV